MTDQEAAELLAQAAADTPTAQKLPEDTATVDRNVAPESDNYVADSIRQIQDDPDSVVDVITKLQRRLGGEYGGELQKLRDEMLAAKQQINERLTTRQPEAPKSDEPDEHGLTDEDYKRLGEVIEKTPQHREQRQKQSAADVKNLDDQTRQFLQGLKTHYGDAITDRDITSLYRMIKKSNYNATDPDLQDEYKEVIMTVESRKKNTSGAIDAEQEKRQQLQQRVNASYEAPTSQGTVSNTQDIWKKSKGESGRTTDASLIEAGKQYMQRLERER